MKPSILVIDDEPGIRDFLDATYRDEGYQVVAVGSGAEAMDAMAAGKYDLVLLDLMLPDMSGIQLLGIIKESLPQVPVVVITAFRETDTAVQAMKLNAFDYLRKPIQLDRLLKVTRKGLDDGQRLRAAAVAADPGALFRGIQDVVPSRSPLMRQVYETITKISAGHSSTVLIQGESGVGKDVIAGLIHRSSSRRAGPFLEINCAALPEHLLETELFGHEKGAFTDAVNQKMGLLEMGHSGTLFLDEIGEMSVQVQVKLLRVLEKMVFRRVGGVKDIAVDVRIIAATNANLADQVAAGSFRQDLYYRLQVVQLRLPPLRARPEDILPLAEYFLGLFNSRFGKKFQEIDPQAKQALLEYPWPGNIRELKNLMERTVLLEDGRLLTRRQLALGEADSAADQGLSGTIGSLLDRPLPAAGIDLESLVLQLEEALVRKAYSCSQGNQSKAARLLGLNRDKFRYRMKQYGIKET